MVETGRARVTVHDVATLSGLSICTVSRALRGLPNVSGDAQRRVEDAAEKLGYRRSAAASRLAGGRTGHVAVVAPRATAWFFAQAVEAAEEVFAAAGLDPVLVSLRGSERVLEEVFGHPGQLSQRFDGLLLLGVELDGSRVGALAESGPAVASVGMRGVPWDNVGIDDEGAGWSATRHLLDLGHWDVAMLAGSEPGDGTAASAGQRRAGYERALAEEDIEVHPDMVVSGESTIEGGYRAMVELISNRSVPSAVFAGCDEAAFGALKAMREHGLAAPKDLSLAGIDDHPMSSFLGLTTVAQPVADQGAFAAALLVDRLQGPDAAGEARDHRLPTSLIGRRTSRRPRRRMT